MILGGLQKNSLIDYPGKVSCVCFVSGCNFKCPYCHNPQLVQAPSPGLPHVEEEVFYSFLENRKGFLDGVVISGGEPTLQKGLAGLCKKVKGMGYSVKLDTNGSRPEAIRELIGEKLIDYIAMDVKTEPQRYSYVAGSDCDPGLILESIAIIMNSGADYEFKTTCARPIVDESVIGKIAKIISGARLYALQVFRDKNVLNPEFFKGKKAIYDPQEMFTFRSIARQYVKECIVR